MESKRDYYEVLGIDRNADSNAIKKAYRKLAKKYHPDSNDGNSAAEQKFKEITEAYTVLSDPEKRKMYDQFGHAAFDGGAGASGGNGYSQGGFYQGYGNPGGGYQEFHFEGGDMDDILKQFFGGGFGQGSAGRSSTGDRYSGRSTGSSGFYGNDFFGGGFGGGNFRTKGEDLRAEVSVSFDEAAFGCDKLMNLSGSDGKAQTIKVHIPAGIEEGKTIRLRGKGNPGMGGGEPGDLLLQIHVGSKPGYERKGMDVYTTVNVPFVTAVLGGETMVQTLYGNVICKIREGTQSGTKIRLKGKGIQAMNNPGVRGDQYVTIQIQVPRDLSEESKRKLREFDYSARHMEKTTHF